jgi:L-threonylcarbamoyladenylate synthase
LSLDGPSRRAAQPVAPGPAAVRQACDELARGGLVAFPTDTVYALACDATNPQAVDRLYAAKRRPAGQPAILLADDAGRLERWVRLDGRAWAMAAEFWPGPLTLVLAVDTAALERLPAPERAALLAIAANGTIAVRVPRHPAAEALLAAWGMPLCTSSANRAGEPAPSTGAEVLARLGADVDLVIDGECPLGTASSILDLTSEPPRLLREGAIPAQRLIS